VAVLGHVCGLCIYVAYAPYREFVTGSEIPRIVAHACVIEASIEPLCCSMVASMAWTMRFFMVWTRLSPKIASLMTLVSRSL
jgi:hypothetical protein